MATNKLRKAEKRLAKALKRVSTELTELAGYLESLSDESREAFVKMVASDDAVSRISFLKDKRRRKMALLAVAVRRQKVVDIKLQESSNAQDRIAQTVPRK